MLAIPILALGGLYIVAKQNESETPTAYNSTEYKKNTLKQEGFENQYIGKQQRALNYPEIKPVSDDNVHKYHSANQTTDKYYNTKIYDKVSDTNPKESVGGGREDIVSLTGDPIVKKNFKHNNMVPFFGGRISGATISADIGESVLDQMQGKGSQMIRKKELGPLFKPDTNLSHAHGAPNASDFYQSRMNPSVRMANVKPWEEEKVAPGLNKGFNSNAGAGFNSGMESRECWQPKSVNQLRTETNPKITYFLSGHEGPANSSIKEYANVEQQGRVEKQMPDTYYSVGPSRWFTTTGAEKAQTTRSVNVLQDVNRTTTSCSYFGAGGDNEATYVKGEYNAPHRHELCPTQIINPSAAGKSSATETDYGMKSYANLPNNRATTQPETPYGIVQGTMKAIATPILDVLRPSRKENVIGSLRQSGNAGAAVSKQPAHNPQDKTKTTIRETTENMLDNNHLNINNQSNQGTGGYLINNYTPSQGQRTTTGCSYEGNPGPSMIRKNQTYEAAYNQRNNTNKTYQNRPNPGGTQMFNHHENICISKLDNDRCNNRTMMPQNTVNIIPSKETHGKLNTPAYNDKAHGCERIQPDLLNAFKNNPYAQSLQSWA